MLTRLYIDNFKCFVDFEYHPAARQLILGRNGSGKSSLLEALLLLRQLAAKGDGLDNSFVLLQRTRWLEKAAVTGELEATLDGDRYRYRVVIEPWGDPPQARVQSESVHRNEKPIFEFALDQVSLFNDQSDVLLTYPFIGNRSALAQTPDRKENQSLSRFRRWLNGLYCFKLNPFDMAARAEREDLAPNVNLSNLAAWYRHLLQAEPKNNAALIKSLSESMDCFRFLSLEPVGENVRVLIAEFEDANRKSSKYAFNELSDGQRSLVCLYVVLHFVLAKGSTVVIDEPENFLALREIQPWLTAVSDILEESGGQILIISHHPELINQWAPSSGVQFVRDHRGAVQVEPFTTADTGLPPAELIARGWDE